VHIPATFLDFDTLARVLRVEPEPATYRRLRRSPCPAHGGGELVVTEGEHGRLLAACDLGCDFAEIIKALKALRRQWRGGRQ
jgi:hypothetical protein